MDTFKQITRVGNGLRVLAPAKINLTLLVAGKRPDGFHELETIMAKINLFDELLIAPGDKSGVELICKGPQWSPAGEDNLVYKAAELLLERHGQDGRALAGSKPVPQVKITLTKNIPAGAGLGGGSSNAAATLLGVNELLNLQCDFAGLTELATQLGSDVAFFLDGPLALCSGKGEKIQKLTQDFNFTALLLLPSVNASTEKAYVNYRHNQRQFESIKIQIDRHIRKNRIDLAARMCANMLEQSCFSLYKELAELKAQVESMDIRPLCLSGSGSAMYHIIENPQGDGAEEYQHQIQQKTGCRCVIITNNRW